MILFFGCQSQQRQMFEKRDCFQINPPERCTKLELQLVCQELTQTTQPVRGFCGHCVISERLMLQVAEAELLCPPTAGGSSSFCSSEYKIHGDRDVLCSSDDGDAHTSIAILSANFGVEASCS